MKNIETRKKKLKGYFGILTEEEANSLISAISEMKKLDLKRNLKFYKF